MSRKLERCTLKAHQKGLTQESDEIIDRTNGDGPKEKRWQELVEVLGQHHRLVVMSGLPMRTCVLAVAMFPLVRERPYRPPLLSDFFLLVTVHDRQDEIVDSERHQA